MVGGSGSNGQWHGRHLSTSLSHKAASKQVSTQMILQSCSSSLVACNIYITSAASAALPSILSRAQDHCRQLRHMQQQQHHHDVETSENKDNTAAAAAAVVHAYADIPYDRSSFHLAGRSDCVSEVAASLIQNALNEIEWKSNDNDASQSTTTTTPNSNKSEARHPFVGLVDHVAIMPISHHDATTSIPYSDAAATAAHEIGDKLQKSNSIKVHYYGHACPQNTPLATIRRKTSFFRSGGANSNNDDITSNEEPTAVYDKGECTIGVPNNFVENYNIRLTHHVDFGTAKTLTQALRGRNIATKGMGVPGVEALTLPYKRDVSRGGDVFEVACNLLEPKTGSVERIEDELEKWLDKQRDSLSTGVINANLEYSRDYFIEDAYRVGTTEEQCLNVLKEANKDDDWNKRYDQQLLSRFTEFLK